MPTSALTLSRRLVVWIMLVMLASLSGCAQLSKLFGKKTTDAGTEEELVDDDTGESTDNTDDISEGDATDTKDTKIGKDAKDTVDTQDLQEDDVATDEDATDEDTGATDEDVLDDIDPGTDTDVVTDATAGDADGSGTGDVDAGSKDAGDASSGDTADSGPTYVGCTKDADCKLNPNNPCVTAFACFVSPDKSSGVCVPAKFAPTGTPCNDNSLCTVSDTCVYSIDVALIPHSDCVGTPKDCEDGKACTDDFCTLGNCKHNANTKVCSDGDPCTDGDHCEAGNCTAGALNHCECSSDADCTDQDSPNPCDGKHKCSSSKCVLDTATVVVCKTTALQSAACQVNACDPSTGQCAVSNSVPNGTACDDKNVCTFPDLCQDGGCAGGKLSCDDGNPCTTDSCVVGTDVNAGAGCQHIENADVCDDGFPCTLNGACSKGSCKMGPYDTASCGCATDDDCASKNTVCGGTYHCKDTVCQVDLATVVTCSDAGDSACATNACSETTGKCAYVFGDATVPCDDGNLCTLADHCNGKGGCVASSKLACTDSNACTDDNCNPTTGCTHSFNQATCIDGNACTIGDVCSLGKCVGSTLASDGKPVCGCTKDGDCTKLDDMCSGTHYCSPAHVCAIVAGSKPADPCAAVTKSPCRTYTCDPVTGGCGAKNVADTSPCDDKNWCTTSDACDAGDCVGTEKVCEDGNDCTVDAACDPTKGTNGCLKVTNKTDGQACTLSNLCLSNTVCTGGTCGGTDKNCDDANPCTIDSCDPAKGCKYATATSATPCDDGNPCTGQDKGTINGADTCSSGICVSGPPKVCTDNNKCTTDSCDPTVTAKDPMTAQRGCLHVPNTEPCVTDICLEGQMCAGGACGGGTPLNCDDGNACTLDSCDANPLDNTKLPGCQHAPNSGAPCSDGSVCTSADTCVSSTCVGTAISVDDNNPCTSDTCDPTTGGIHTNNPAGNCGPLATCDVSDTPKCKFATKPILISEVYFGDPSTPDDDWIELHNPTGNLVELPGYTIEVNVATPGPTDGWTPIAVMGTSDFIQAHGYTVIGRKKTLDCTKDVDIIAPTFSLTKATAVDPSGTAKTNPDTGAFLTIDVAQYRVRDAVNQLVHDRMCFYSSGCTDLAEAVTPITLTATPGQSFERRANAGSTAKTMARYRSDWLAGNDYTEGATPDDNFLIRDTPDPQPRALAGYEPACGGTCSEGTMCNFVTADEQCVDDKVCSVCCGSGKSCFDLGGAHVCVADTPGVVFSEVMPGGLTDLGQQFIELYNASGVDVDLSGMQVIRHPVNQVASDDGFVIHQFAPGTKILAKHYFNIATDVFAKGEGRADVVLPNSLGLDPTGGALLLRDAKTNVDMDIVGWGGAKACSNCANGKNSFATITQGASIERKANKDTNQYTMMAGGFDSLSGNAWDTDNDAIDWYERETPEAQSAASGQFEPACGGYCFSGLACPFTGTSGGTCTDPGCGGKCTQIIPGASPPTSGPGFGCNYTKTTPACEPVVVFAEIGVQGPSSTTKLGNLPLKAADNEYIMLYNRGENDVALDGLGIQFRALGALKWTTAVDLSSANGGKPMNGYVIHPHSYFLITTTNYDSKLPAPNFVSKYAVWGLNPDASAIRIVDATNFEYDKVAWGTGLTQFSEGGAPSAGCTDLTGTCTLRRLPMVGAPILGTMDLFSPWYYAGAGYDTGFNVQNVFPINTRAPRNSCGSPDGCVGNVYNVQTP